MSTVPYPQFPGNAEEYPFFWYLRLLVLRRNKILGNVLVCLKENCPGFQQTPLDIMSGVSLPILYVQTQKF